MIDVEMENENNLLSGDIKKSNRIEKERLLKNFGSLNNIISQREIDDAVKRDRELCPF